MEDYSSNFRCRQDGCLSLTHPKLMTGKFRRRVVQKVFRYAEQFRRDTRVCRTDRQTYKPVHSEWRFSTLRGQ